MENKRFKNAIFEEDKEGKYITLEENDFFDFVKLTDCLYDALYENLQECYDDDFIKKKVIQILKSYEDIRGIKKEYIEDKNK